METTQAPLEAQERLGEASERERNLTCTSAKETETREKRRVTDQDRSNLSSCSRLYTSPARFEEGTINAPVACAISQRYRYYRCCGKTGVDIAHHFQVPAGPLEDKVWNDVQTILTYPEIIQEQLEVEAQTTDTILQERIAEAEEAIASLELAERRVISLYSLGKFDEQKIDDEVDRIRTEREGWRQELANLQQRLEAKLELVAQKQRLEEICRTIDVGFDGLSFEQKREILQALGLRVRVKQDRSYECFAALPAICESSATLGSWGRLTNPIPLEFEGVI